MEFKRGKDNPAFIFNMPKIFIFSETRKSAGKIELNKPAFLDLIICKPPKGEVVERKEELTGGSC